MAQVNIAFARWNSLKEEVEYAWYIQSLPEDEIPNFVAIKKKGHEAFPPVRGWSYAKSQYIAEDGRVCNEMI